MATVPLSYKNAASRGVPAFEVLDLFTNQNLMAGAEPAVEQPIRLLLADSLDLAQFTVVGLNSSGKLVKATYNATLASAIVPIGVLVYPATSGSSNTTKYGVVFRTGCFNAGDDSPLVWDSSFDTLAKKTEWLGVLQNPSLIFRAAAL